MHRNKIYTLFILNAAMFFSVLGSVCAKDSGLNNLEDALRKSAREIFSKLKGKICILDFTELRESDSLYTSEFGQTVANYLQNNFVNQKNRKYEVVERRELIKIMRDSILFGNDSQTIDRLQKEAGMDVLVSGSYSSAGTEISVSIKAVSAKTGGILASANCRIEKSAGLEKMMAHRFSQFGVPEDKTEDTRSGDVLEIETGVFYEGGDGKLYPIREGMVLTSKDNYAIYARPKQNCYLYIYQVDSSQKAVKLFPSLEFKTGKNPINAGLENWIPNNKEFLFLDENPGREEIYILATKSPATSLESIKELTSSEIQTAIKTMGVGGKRGSEIVKKVKGTQGNAMELISRKLISQGDFFYKLSFIHQ